MTLPFSSRQSVRKLRDNGGFSEPQADAIVEVVEDATKELVTKEYFETRLRAELYRALWIFSGVVLTGVAGIAAITLAVAQWMFG